MLSNSLAITEIKKVPNIYKNTIALATPAPISHRTPEENLGLGYIASVLRQKKYNVVIIDGWLCGMQFDEVAKAILEYEDLLWVGFSCYRSNIEQAFKSIRLIKKSSNVPIVAGGYGPTFHPNEFLYAGIDIVVRGEGEQVVLDLCEHFKNGKPALQEIKSLSFMLDGKPMHNELYQKLEDIDLIPFPARDTMDAALKQRTPLHIVSARGCTANCLFCSIVSFMRLSKGAQWRQRSINNLVDEIEMLNKGGIRHFKIVDDSLLEPPRNLAWCSALANEIESRRLDVHMRSSVRADMVDDEIVAELARAGFFSFSCGIENFSQSALTRMNKTATLEQNIAALEAFRRHKIYVQAGHILFDYGTTMPELYENLRYMRRYIWTVSKGIFTEMFAADGTPYTRLLEKKGLLQKDDSGSGNHKYTICDADAYKVYCALKIWHKSHMKIYDKSIDPISSPKALEPDELAMLDPICMKLREKDLDFFQNVLKLAEQQESVEDLLIFTNREIDRSADWYSTVDMKVDLMYSKLGLIYNAAENPFMH